MVFRCDVGTKMVLTTALRQEERVHAFCIYHDPCHSSTTNKINEVLLSAAPHQHEWMGLDSAYSIYFLVDSREGGFKTEKGSRPSKLLPLICYSALMHQVRGTPFTLTFQDPRPHLHVNYFYQINLSRRFEQHCQRGTLAADGKLRYKDWTCVCRRESKSKQGNQRR